MEDEEKLLMERDSEIYEEKIRKARMRDAMLRVKSRGYENVRRSDIPILKIFIGYASQLDLLQHPELAVALSLSVARSAARPGIEAILRDGLTALEDILAALGGAP